MNKKKAIILAAMAVILVGVGTTLAILSAISGSVTTDFVIGDIEISLEETTGGEYQLIPGTTVKKDPTVTVIADSEDCWLFIRVEKTRGFDDYVSYSIADGWLNLTSVDGVFYRVVEKSETDMKFPILSNDEISVRDVVTKEVLASVSVNPNMTFSTYAVQMEGVDTALTAWNLILKEMEE